MSLNLPETVGLCPCCKGEGEYEQRYIEGRFTGPCEMCRGAQWVYKITCRAVPESVRNQIVVANKLERKKYPLMGGGILYQIPKVA